MSIARSPALQARGGDGRRETRPLRALLLAAPLALAACISHYQPPLTVTPTDVAKYEADRQACIAEGEAADRQARAGSFLPRASEVLGRIAPSQSRDDPRTYAGQARIIDRCMTERGYAVLAR